MSLTVYPREAPPAPPPKLFDRLRAAPHRIWFGCGVLSFLFTLIWWVAELSLARSGHVPAYQAHALLTLQGLFPLFMAGFIFTAGPRWLQTSDRLATGHIALALMYLAGVLINLSGWRSSGLGALLMLLVWQTLTLRWSRLVATSPASDKLHARALLAAMAGGGISLLATVLWLRSADGTTWLFARSLTLWGWLLPVFLIVSHRMLPFFTQSAIGVAAWRPAWLLHAWLGGCALIAIGQIGNLPPLTAAAAAGMAGLLTYTSIRWGIRASLQNRLLAMLHLSFAWLPIAFALFVIDAAAWPLGSAPMHALGLGFCCTMLVGFVTRVTLGHSGRPLQADNTYWGLYLALHGVAVVRVAAALGGAGAMVLSATAAVWLLLMLAWAARVLPVYWQARVDGQAG